ncbi:hypothetical protein U1Q18_050438, partial [Sarracenia purpurea var. burkii]
FGKSERLAMTNLSPKNSYFLQAYCCLLPAAYYRNIEDAPYWPPLRYIRFGFGFAPHMASCRRGATRPRV